MSLIDMRNIKLTAWGLGKANHEKCSEGRQKEACFEWGPGSFQLPAGALVSNQVKVCLLTDRQAQIGMWGHTGCNFLQLSNHRCFSCVCLLHLSDVNYGSFCASINGHTVWKHRHISVAGSFATWWSKDIHSYFLVRNEWMQRICITGWDFYTGPQLRNHVKHCKTTLVTKTL